MFLLNPNERAYKTKLKKSNLQEAGKIRIFGNELLGECGKDGEDIIVEEEKV